jgi:hypothetical protein
VARAGPTAAHRSRRAAGHGGGDVCPHGRCREASTRCRVCACGLPLWPSVGAGTAGLRSAWAAAVSASSTASAAWASSRAAEDASRSGTGPSAAVGERGSAWLNARVTPSSAAVNSLGITQNVLPAPLASWAASAGTDRPGPSGRDRCGGRPERPGRWRRTGLVRRGCRGALPFGAQDRALFVALGGQNLRLSLSFGAQVARSSRSARGGCRVGKGASSAAARWGRPVMSGVDLLRSLPRPGGASPTCGRRRARTAAGTVQCRFDSADSLLVAPGRAPRLPRTGAGSRSRRPPSPPGNRSPATTSRTDDLDLLKYQRHCAFSHVPRARLAPRHEQILHSGGETPSDPGGSARGRIDGRGCECGGGREMSARHPSQRPT